MRKISSAIILVLTVLVFSESALFAAESTGRAPEFTHQAPADWINSKPLTIEQLKGNVVLIDFWTFACWNCYRSFPWLNAFEEKYEKQGLRIIGVHSPEFGYEKEHANVARKVKEFKLKHPIMIDNDHSYWKAMGNRYWPAFYIIDKKGTIRGRFIGETHAGDARAKEIEKLVAKLLAE